MILTFQLREEGFYCVFQKYMTLSGAEGRLWATPTTVTYNYKNELWANFPISNHISVLNAYVINDSFSALKIVSNHSFSLDPLCAG